LRFDPSAEAVVFERLERLGAFVVSRRPAPTAADPTALAEVLFQALRSRPDHALRWSKTDHA
jgi:hypothetical protein